MVEISLMKKINILNLTTSFVIGGAEKVLLDLILCLDKERFNPSIIALSEHADMLEEYKSQGVKAQKLDMKKNPRDFIRVYQFLNRYIIENKIDVLHAHLTHTLPHLVLLKLRHPKLKVVFTSHNTNVGGKHRELMIWLSKPFRNADIVFSKDMINKLYKKNTEVIINGVNIDKFKKKAVKNTPFTFLNIGSIREKKNQIFLIECAKYLKSKGYKFVIDIVGGGVENQPLIDKISKAIEKEKLGNYVRMLGLRSDIPNLLKTAHCMVLPSYHEGLPIVLLEAGAAKLPIISTPVGAIPDLIDSTNGYLSTLGDFCKTMELVYNNYSEAEEKARKLSQKIDQQYSIRSMTESHQKLYTTLLK